MSIIVKSSSGIELFCKGADNVIEARLDPLLNDSELLDLVKTKLNDFSDVGLRTMMTAWKPLSEDEYVEFKAILDQAENALENREELVMQAYESIEQRLLYNGCTAIEDRLQDQLPETIEYLLKVISFISYSIVQN
jgi:magnesium-transporting ATPase (P-type)